MRRRCVGGDRQTAGEARGHEPGGGAGHGQVGPIHLLLFVFVNLSFLFSLSIVKELGV